MSELKAALRTLTDLEFLVGRWNDTRRDEQHARAALAQTIDSLPPALAAPLRAMIFGEEAATDPALAPAIAVGAESAVGTERAAIGEGAETDEQVARIESAAVEERASSSESTPATDDEGTASTEPAEVRESAVLNEPAEPDDSAVPLEQAEVAESAEREEPLVERESARSAEPAASRESTEVPERAVEAESTVPHEPAEDNDRAAAAERDDPWISLQAYATLNGVSEPVVYAACVKGKIYGDAYRLGPPKRVRAHLADEQILEAGDATFLRQKVMARLGRARTPAPTTDHELLPPRLTAAEAVNAMRRRQYEVMAGRKPGTWVVNGKTQTTAEVMERAQEIVDREWRLAQARRKERAA